MSQTKEQLNARYAYNNVLKHAKSESMKQKYGTLAHKLPILIRTCGLVAALEFVETRKEKDGPKQLLDDLNQHCRERGLIGKNESIRQKAMTAELQDYLRLTREVSSIVTWYKRFSVSVLEVEQGNEGNV